LGRTQARAQAVQGAFSLGDYLFIKCKWVAIAGIEDHHPQYIALMDSQKFFDGHQVAQGFGHLFAGKLEHPIMDPIAGKLFSGKAFGLSDFVFVMGKNQIIPAAMDVDLLTKVFQIHG
jgi:hypothetical protein